jgi:AraC family transcriptional regulator
MQDKDVYLTYPGNLPYFHVGTGTFFRPDPAPDHRVSKAMEHLQAHLSEKIPLQELARLALLSPFHFQRLFKKTVGLTPKEFLLRLRVEKIKLLMKEGTSLSKIAAETGFTDQSHLIRTFKKLTGTTPREFHNRTP